MLTAELGRAPGTLTPWWVFSLLPIPAGSGSDSPCPVQWDPSSCSRKGTSCSLLWYFPGSTAQVPAGAEALRHVIRIAVGEVSRA